MAKQLLLFYFCLTLYACSAQNCNDLPETFNSYEQAKNLITTSKFSQTDKANTSNSSWVKSAKFYSCDNKTGFFIIGTVKREYTHQNVPIEVWKNFKAASSFGQFYNQNIKNKYQLKVRQ